MEQLFFCGFYWCLEESLLVLQDHSEFVERLLRCSHIIPRQIKHCRTLKSVFARNSKTIADWLIGYRWRFVKYWNRALAVRSLGADRIVRNGEWIISICLFEKDFSISRFWHKHPNDVNRVWCHQQKYLSSGISAESQHYVDVWAIRNGPSGGPDQTKLIICKAILKMLMRRIPNLARRTKIWLGVGKPEWMKDSFSFINVIITMMNVVKFESSLSHHWHTEGQIAALPLWFKTA